MYDCAKFLENRPLRRDVDSSPSTFAYAGSCVDKVENIYLKHALIHCLYSHYSNHNKLDFSMSTSLVENKKQLYSNFVTNLVKIYY